MGQSTWFLSCKRFLKLQLPCMCARFRQIDCRRQTLTDQSLSCNSMFQLLKWLRAFRAVRDGIQTLLPGRAWEAPSVLSGCGRTVIGVGTFSVPTPARSRSLLASIRPTRVLPCLHQRCAAQLATPGNLALKFTFIWTFDPLPG